MRIHLGENIDGINVVVTTYDLASKKQDAKFLRQLKPVVRACFPFPIEQSRHGDD